MRSNVEIKATLRDRAKVEAIAARMSDTGPETIHQEDFFFVSEPARLKLRVLDSRHGELIRYNRPDNPDARRSDYVIARTSDPQVLLDILTQELGRVGVVRKTRTLYVIGQTRVHLDQVQELGDFLELEVVLRSGQADSEGKDISASLLAAFGIERRDLIGAAYIDLLLAKKAAS
jgi:predicted adenylyl cyclase CyaB